MNRAQRDQPLQSAQAAARRVLVRAIDLRFDLDDTADVAASGHAVPPRDLQRLRADADALCLEIDRLAEALQRQPDSASIESEEMDEAAAAA